MQREFSIGAHLTAPRRTCVHHGVYIGNGRVIHNKWFVFNFIHCGVCEVSLSEFSLGRTITQHKVCSTFTPEDIIERARSRIGERGYNLFSNNCEHFTRWCLTGVSRSLQIEMWQARLQFSAKWAWRRCNKLGHQACQQQT